VPHAKAVQMYQFNDSEFRFVGNESDEGPFHRQGLFDKMISLTLRVL